MVICQELMKPSGGYIGIFKILLSTFCRLEIVELKTTLSTGLPCWSSGKESALRCKGHRFDI